MGKSSRQIFKPYEQGQVQLLPPSLDSLISEQHPVRVINTVIDGIDFSSIIALYPGGGAPSFHPRMMLKVLVYAYLRNIYSSRKIEQAVTENIHFMWLSGGNQPDHNSINRFRTERMKEILQEVFTQVVVLLNEAGHLDIKDLYTDGTKIEANANRYTFVWAKSIIKNRERISQQLKEMWSYAESVAKEELMDTQPCDFDKLDPKEVAKTIDTIDQALSPKPEVDKKKKEKVAYAKKIWPKKLEQYQAQEDTLGQRNSYSKTDPDATFMRMKDDHMKNGQLKPGYNIQISTNNQFILHYSVFSDQNDIQTLKPHIQGFAQRYGQYPTQHTADAGYGSEENYAFHEGTETEAFIKYSSFHKEQKKQSLIKEPFHQSRLHYNPEKDVFICPMGQEMANIGSFTKETTSGYVQQITKYQARNCRNCPLKGVCHNSKGNRIIEVNFALNKYRKDAKEKLNSPEGIEKRKRRGWEVEAAFGNLKQNQGLRRFLLRGKKKVDIEFGLYALAHNLRKYAASLAEKLPKLEIMPVQKGKESCCPFGQVTIGRISSWSLKILTYSLCRVTSY